MLLYTHGIHMRESNSAREIVCRSVLQCAAVCCSVLQRRASFIHTHTGSETVCIRDSIRGRDSMHAKSQRFRTLQHTATRCIRDSIRGRDVRQSETFRVGDSLYACKESEILAHCNTLQHAILETPLESETCDRVRHCVYERVDFDRFH